MLMRFDFKVFIRLMFIAASLSMTIANFPKGSFALLASVLFLVGNILALIVNFEKKERKGVRLYSDREHEIEEVVCDIMSWDGSMGSGRNFGRKVNEEGN